MGIRNHAYKQKMKVLAIALTLLAVACIAQAQDTFDDCLDANGANGMAWCSDNGDEMCYNSLNECTGDGCFFCYTSSGSCIFEDNANTVESAANTVVIVIIIIAVVCPLCICLKAIPRSTVVIKR